MENKIFIMCGIVGSGKSTRAKELLSVFPNAVIVSKDDIRTMLFGEYCYDKNKEFIAKAVHAATLAACNTYKKDIVVDETHITEKSRKVLIDWANKINYIPFIVYCKGDGNNLKNRMKNPRGYTKERWKNVIKEMEENFEEPTEFECKIIPG